MRNKYHAIRVRKYDSKAEKEYADVLELLKRAGKIESYEHHPEPVVLMKASDGKDITWKIDFLITNKEKQYYVEVKGFKTADFIIKLKMYRNLQIRLPLFVVKRYGDLRYKITDTVDGDNRLNVLL